MNNYETTHIKTYRFKCKKTATGFPVSTNGNYESMLSFKNLPPFKELKKTGRAWEYTKNYSPVIDRIVLDIDCDGDLDKSLEVTTKIIQDLDDYKDCINIYFSGSKGFHIEILTDGLEIINTGAEKPSKSCYPYLEFLTYFEDKYPEVDLSLKDGVTRIIRRHHTKHEKTDNYKILVDINAGIDDIIEYATSNTDMVDSVNDYLDNEQALSLLDKFNKPIEKNIKFNDFEYEIDYNNVDDSIYAVVFNELNTNLHHRIGLLGSGLNGYVTPSELENIYNLLCEKTNIEDSTNSKQSFIDAYNYDKKECSLGALYSEYEKEKLDFTNFFKLSDYLNDKIYEADFKNFNNIMQKHDNDLFELLESELFDYVDNTENIIKGVINGLSALYGYGSRFIVVNGGAEVGKSEFVKTIEKLMPRFKDVGSSTPASVRRQDTHTFDKRIVYLGDKGLKGKDDDEFIGLQEVFGGLITEGKFIRDLVVGESVMEFNLKSDGVCVFYTEPYTNLRKFGAGDQYTTRTTYITVNPVENGLNVFLNATSNDKKENTFYKTHKNYIEYILKHPIELDLSYIIRTNIYNASKQSLRSAYYLEALFKAYCQYKRLDKPAESDLNKFLNIFKPKYDITDIEYEIYLKLYNNLKPLKSDELQDLFFYDEYGKQKLDQDCMLRQRNNRKDKSFFTAKQIKTYFKYDFQMNKNIKDTLDNIPEILNNLFMAGYLERVEEQYNNQNVYYIPYNVELGD